jgi:NADH-quinone oxidoreductase subunit L
LAAIPPLTIAFNSKDLILNTVWSLSTSSKGLWLAGTFGAFLTAMYSFRLLYVVFFGETKTTPNKKPAAIMVVPLSILAFLAAISGLPEMLSSFFGVKTFYNFLQTSMPQPAINSSLPANELLMQIFYALISVLGIGLIYAVYRRENKIFNTSRNTFIGSYLHKFMYAGFGFDWVYHHLFVLPYIWIARVNRNDILDSITTAGVYTCRYSNLLLSKTVNGNLRWYAACVGIGAVVLLGILILV